MKVLKIELGRVFDPTMSLEQWAEEGRDIYHQAERLTWQLADWAAFGERTLGKLKEFALAQGMPYQTLANYSWVASNVDISRRREKLSFSHHAEVAHLPARDQDKWLGRAEKESWSVVELRRQIRGRTELSDGVPFKFEDRPAVDLQQLLLSKPAGYWTPTTKKYWREKLEPIVQFYESTLA